ncbi:hypothetical protein BS78_10G238100 [Paspalum vaginatum]|nr:hypothetical protein BS78_10G238100 [Paspalum vaginatum]
MEWLFPGAVYAAVDVTAGSNAGSSEHDRAPSSSPTFSVVKAAESNSFPSSPSSSSSDEYRPRHATSPQQSPSAAPLCFGAGGTWRLLWGARAGAASMAPKGDAVGKYLRRISRRLRRARSGGQVSPSPSGAAAVDDTARESAESVARAIAYCKDTLRRGAPAPSPSPSLGDWLHDGQEEIIASAAAPCNERGDSRPAPPRPRRPGWSLEMQTLGNRRKEPPCRDSSVTASAVINGKEPPHHDHATECRGESVKAAAAAAKPLRSPSDLAAVELETFGSFDEMELLKIFDGDDEVIDHHFIGVQV